MMTEDEERDHVRTILNYLQKSLTRPIDQLKVLVRVRDAIAEPIRINLEKENRRND
jgi:hypothetical protein